MTRVGGHPSAVTLVAVTKGFGPEAVLAAVANGLTDLGENYADELVSKAAAVAAQDPGAAAAIRWHFQGNLQTNKINRLAPLVHLWQTVPSANRAASLAQRVPGASVLVQVNLVGAQNRPGCAPADVPAVVAACRELGLRTLGLMGVGPAPGLVDLPREGDRDSATAFALLRQLADAEALPVRSMGMSDDFEVAIGAGSTMIRVGSFLFGRRERNNV
jgi:pyridoxal phosphate enzyme (YggS family)